MATLIWTAKAVEQVEQIASYIEKDSPFQAHRVVQHRTHVPIYGGSNL